jgi:hypothetical protein
MPIATPQGTLDFKSVDKVTFVGASSNTVIDTTTGSLGVGVGVNGPTSNLHVVGNTRLEGDIDMLHTANTASIKLNSNVVTEFPRSKKLIKYPRVALTSASQDGYVVSASNVSVNGDGYAAYRVFDNILPDGTTTVGWRTDVGYDSATGLASGITTRFTGDSGEWVEIQLPNSLNLSSINLKPGNEVNLASSSTRFPKVFVIYGYNGNAWVRVEEFTTSPIQSFTDVQTFHISNPVGEFSKFVLVVKQTYSVTGAPSSVVNIGEIEYFGLPEYDPEAHGTDVVVKSVPNVPNTDWLEVYYDAKDLTSVSGTIADLSGKSVAGTLNGDVSLDTSNNVKSFSFDGSGDYISGTLTNTGDFDFTVSAWINRNVTGSDHTIWQIGLGSNSNNPNASTCLSISNEQLDYFIFSGPSVKVLDYADKYPTQTWVHIVCERVGNELSIYINGKIQTLDYSGTPSDTLSIVSNSTFHIGARTGTQLGVNPMNGKIANFRLFNRALTSDEIWQLYAYQKEYFGHGDLSMTLKAGRLGIGTSEPRAMLDVRGPVRIYDTELTNPVYAEFSSNYATTGLSDEQIAGWRDPSNNILDFNVVTRQSSHNAFDADSALGVRGSFTVPHDGVYVVYYAALINRVSTSSHIYIHVNGSNANGTGINSHQNRNTVGSMWTTLTIQRVLRLNRGDKVQCYIIGGFYTLNNYSFGSIYQIGA